jgi:hypothetical protein
MTREESKYCEECKHCRAIYKDAWGSYEVVCWFGPNGLSGTSKAIYFCNHKKLKKEKKENVK